MGQIPLPERIPPPTSTKQKDDLERMGIILLPFLENDRKKEYCPYTMPEGWRMVNTNPDGRQDLPEYHIIDDKNQMRVFVGGSWRVHHGKHLHLSILKNPKLYEPSLSKIKSPELRWEKCLQRYNKTVTLSDGACLTRQIHIDLAYEELVSCCLDHSQLPEKHILL